MDINDTKSVLLQGLEFHGHRCWDSVAGVRIGLAALRISYKPMLQEQIGESAFMTKRGQRIEPDNISEIEQMELVDLVRNAPEADILTIEAPLRFDRDWIPETIGFLPCAACHELTARAYLHVVGDKHVCIP